MIPSQSLTINYLRGYMLTMSQGGTVGDIESKPFAEALSQLRYKVGRGNFLNIHVTYIPTYDPPR